MEAVQFKLVGDVAVLSVNNPPVNSLGLEVRKGLSKYAKECASNPNVNAIVIIGSGKTFPAGADISEFPQMRAAIARGDRSGLAFPLSDVIQEIENLEKPVIAAIHGTALGGGLEIALGCHYRIANEKAKMGLPEVQLGILPGAGGTQRLPRLIDLQNAMKMITSGAPIAAKKALEIGLIDFVAPSSVPLLDFAVQYAHDTAKQSIPVSTRRVSKRDVLPVPPQFAFDMARRAASRVKGFIAPLACIDAIEVACQRPFAEGMAFEAETIARLMVSPQAAAQQYFFFAQRMASKVPGVPNSSSGIAFVGIIGAGTMGAGIAMNFIQVGIKVVLLDVKEEYIERAKVNIMGNYASAVHKRRMKQQQVDQIMSLIRFTTKYEDLSNCDLVIEAVFEDMKIKKDVLTTLDRVCKPSALLCTNTSTLDVDEIASCTSRPSKVVGTHFFSPANIMKLLEIVRGAQTSPETLSVILDVSKRIKKVAVVVGNCRGFVGNRLLEWYGREAAFLMEEGASPQQIDKVLQSFGMAMGPFAMGDLAGMDVGHKIRASMGLLDPATRPKGRYHGAFADKLVKMNRLGQKTGKGIYLYKKGSRKPIVDPEIERMISDHRKSIGITPRVISDEEILERCMLPLINDGFNVLHEGIALRPSDIDVVYVYGYGFPVYRGGPMFYGNSIGLDKMVHKMDAYAARFPDAEYWKASPLLRKLASARVPIEQWMSPRNRL